MEQLDILSGGSDPAAPDVVTETLPATLAALPDVRQYATQPAEVRKHLHTSVVRLAQSVKARILAIDERHDPRIKEAHELHKEAIAAKRTEAAPWQAAKVKLDALFLGYERHERDEQARLQREAEERERQRQKEEAAALAKEAEERRLQEAQALLDEGDIEAAESVLDAPPAPPPPPALPPIVERAVPKQPGQTLRGTWKARVTNPTALLKAAAAGSAPATFFVVSPQAINEFARATKGTVRVAGLEFYFDETVATRS